MADNKRDDSYVWISYSDLMTTVTFAFIFLLLATLAIHQDLSESVEKSKSMLSKATEHVNPGQEALGTLVKTKASAGLILKAIREEIQKFGECREVIWTIDETNTSVSATFGRNGQGWFRDGEANLSGEAQVCLKQFAILWLSKLYEDKLVRVNLQNLIIEGHTNSRPISSTENSFLDNLDLSQRRAFSASKFILRDVQKAHFSKFASIKSDWMSFELWRNQKLTATGRSFSEPITHKDGKENFEHSKRIVFRCLIKQDFAAMEEMSKGKPL